VQITKGGSSHREPPEGPVRTAPPSASRRSVGSRGGRPPPTLRRALPVASLGTLWGGGVPPPPRSFAGLSLRHPMGGTPGPVWEGGGGGSPPLSATLVFGHLPIQAWATPPITHRNPLPIGSGPVRGVCAALGGGVPHWVEGGDPGSPTTQDLQQRRGACRCLWFRGAMEKNRTNALCHTGVWEWSGTHTQGRWEPVSA